MKKLVTAIVVLILVLSVTVFAESALTATEKARSYAPANAEYLYTEKDGQYYEVHFLSAETMEEFEIIVPISGDSPVKLETDTEGEKGSQSSTFTDESVKNTVLWEYPGAEIDSILRVKEDGLFEIHVYFKTAEMYGLMELNAETGRVLERKIIFTAPSDGWQTSLSDDYAEDKIASASGEAPKASSGSASSGKSSSGNSSSGSSSSGSSSGRISISQAKSVITSRYPGAKITEIELDKENGKYVYEGEAVYNGKEYDFEIDASTGKLRQWERDD